MDVKTGYKTTEFWVTIISQFIGLLTLGGIIVPAQATQLVKSVADIVGGVVAIIPAIVYIYNRTWLKAKTAVPTKVK